MCSKLIHLSGVARVYVVAGGYLGENGVPYLEANGVELVQVEGPQDPRVRI